MRKIKKIAAVSVALTLIMVLLCGCEGLAKRKALGEYGQQLQSDVPYWNDLSEASGQVNNSDMTTMKAIIQSRIVPDLKTISSQASARNSTITDSELKTIDTDYVNAVTHMSEAYGLILDGINNNDRDKMNKAMTELNVSMSSLQNYGTGLQSYCKKYGIESKEIDEMTNMFK